MRTERVKLHRTLSLLTLGVGLVLLVRQITVESEPGAIPLLLVLGGLAWYFTTRARARRRG